MAKAVGSLQPKGLAGILLIVGVDHAEFGLTLRVIEAALANRPTQDAWAGYAAWDTRSTAT